MTKIAFIEDDPLYLNLIKGSIQLQPGLVCVLTALSMEEFWQQYHSKLKIDVLFVDIDLPGQSGIGAIPKLRKELPKAEIIMLSSLEDSQYLFQALHSGANGYLVKDFSAMQLPRYLNILQQGGALISPQMSRRLIQYFNPKEKKQLHHDLGPKEQQLLDLFATGASYEEAALALGISVNGVRYHVRNIYQKLSVDNKIDAINSYKQGKGD